MYQLVLDQVHEIIFLSIGNARKNVLLKDKFDKAFLILFLQYLIFFQLSESWPITKKYPFLFTDPPEVSSAKRAVYAGPGDRDVLTCIVKAEPRANVSLFDCRSRTNDIYQVRIFFLESQITLYKSEISAWRNILVEKLLNILKYFRNRKFNQALSSYF